MIFASCGDEPLACFLSRPAGTGQRTLVSCRDTVATYAGVIGIAQKTRGRMTEQNPMKFALMTASQRKAAPWNQLNKQVISCTQCPRLVQHCQNVSVEKRAAYRDEDYWGKPVPNFGDPAAELLIVGLAPGAHGANRTGRMFTGDRSGDWLFKALHTTGFANQSESTDLSDGLTLTNCAITAACHCAPPGNKPTTEEIANCAPWLAKTLSLLNTRVIVALGAIGWNATWKHFQIHHRDDLLPERKPKFSHNACVDLTESIKLIGSYHPSQQNTFTGRLTRRMLNDVFRKAAKVLTAANP